MHGFGGRGQNRGGNRGRGNFGGQTFPNTFARDVANAGQPTKPGFGSNSRAPLNNNTNNNYQGQGGRLNQAPRPSPPRNGLSSRDPLDQLEVRGLKQSKAASNHDGGVSDLIAFLERKANTHDVKGRDPVKIIKSYIQGDQVIIGTRPQDTQRILRLNSYTFAGTQLSIKQSQTQYQNNSNHVTNGARGRSPPAKPTRPDENQPSESAQQIKVQMRDILSNRFDANNKYLDLAGLGKDPQLLSMNAFETPSTAAKFFQAMMKVLDEQFTSREQKRDAIVSVSLANNSLRNLTLVTSLAPTLLDIKNLDLSNNKFENMTALNAWRWKFRALDHLILSGNPIERGEPNYADTLRRWYPTLRLLNNQPLRSDQEASTALAAKQKADQGKLPVTKKPGKFADPDHVAENFLKNFFVSFDNDRNTLVEAVYDDKSMFSFNVSTDQPQRHYSSRISWDSFLKGSRNLTKITHLPSRMSRLHTGSQAIRQCFANLPPTRHPDIVTETKKYLLECQPISQLPDPVNHTVGGVEGLLVTVHSEFESANADNTISKRSFDRTLILGPGGATGVRVVHDMLSLRPHAGPDAFIEDESEDTAAEGRMEKLRSVLPAGFGENTPGKSAEQAQQERTVGEFAAETGLTLEYAGMCLTESQWNWANAGTAFQNARGTLPSEAFL